MINPMIEQVRKNPASGGFGINQIFSIGVLVISLCVSTLAVDLPFYFAAQNQLQTAVNAAALAGAANLPDGNDEAVEAALDMAAQNPVTNKILEESNLTFDSNGNVFEVRGEVEVDTIMAKILCGLTGVVDTVAGDGDGGEGEGESSGMSCNSMKVGAYAKALPAARDTILVIDMSTSMDDLGGDQPVTDVKEAGIAFVDQVLALDSESVDRIGVVSFDRYGNNRISLTSQNDSANFEAVKGAIMDMPLYGGGGWNTNFQAGMQVAMDEMLANGRQNAKKTIVFMTDG
ncbi:MAG: VWA domain-containing protein, partial [Vampirovibrio sp.]|nr:VWA domain-containing protein [Vampirovibrio sp.]